MKERCSRCRNLLLVTLSHMIAHSSQYSSTGDVAAPGQLSLWAKMGKDHEDHGEADFSLRIIGGTYAEQTMPWVVKIDRAGYNSITCTGQVVESRWIVTAAHCLMNADLNGFVGAGGTRVVYNCSDTRSDDCIQANAVKVVVHPCYAPALERHHDDIALIQLDRDLGIQPVLVDGWQVLADLSEGTEVSLAGFGVVRSEDAEGSPRLMRVAVPLASKEKCVAANPTDAEKGNINFDHVWCTGGTEGKDSCAGDSGGPAVYEADGRPCLVGVLSIGSELPAGDVGLRNCGVEGRYGVYTKVRFYTKWMVATIEEGGYAAPAECPSVGIFNTTSDSLSGAGASLGVGATQAWALCSLILLQALLDVWR